MNVLSQFWPIREGHFVWCSYRNESQHVSIGCDHCKTWAYLFSFVLTVAVAKLQFWTSEVTRSLPLESDAWHMTSDSLGYVIGMAHSSVWVSMFLARFNMALPKKVTEGAMVLFLTVAIVAILGETVEQWFQSRPPTILRSDLLLAVAVLGLATNGVLFLFLRALGLEHSHSHHHDHHQHEKDMVLSGNIKHTFTDFISSVAVVFSALVARYANQPGLLSFVNVAVPLLIVCILGKQIYETVEGWQSDDED